MHAEPAVRCFSSATLAYCKLTDKRRRYKGKKISYGVDEAAQPYPPPPAPKLRKENAPPKKGLTAVPNRFQLLNLDDADEDEIAAAFQSKKSVGITA